MQYEEYNKIDIDKDSQMDTDAFSKETAFYEFEDLVMSGR